MFIFNKMCWDLFPLKSCYCGKIFMSIQVVLNVWEQFKVQHLDIFALQWTSVAHNFIKGPFSIIFVGKIAHTSLVYVVKISYQSKRSWVTKKHFSKGRFSHRCDFLPLFFLYFLTFQNNFADTMSQLSDIFFHWCVYMLVLNHFVV